jgi:hypothetical protein
MEYFGWVVWLLVAAISVVSAVNKNKKKREEEAASMAERRAKPIGEKFADTLADLVRNAVGEEPSQTVVSRTGGSGTGSGSGAGSGYLGHGGSSGMGSGSGSSSGGFGRAGGAGAGAGGGAKPARRSLTEILEELARAATEQQMPVPPVAFPSRPMMASQSEATSHDYYSLEDEYDTVDDRGYFAEEPDAERRYSGGEFGSVGGERGLLGGEWGSAGGERGLLGGEWGSAGGERGPLGGGLHSGGTKGSAVRADRFEAEIAAYERLTAQRARRSTLASTGGSPTGVVSSAKAEQADYRTADDSTDSMGSTGLADNAAPTTLRELLGGDFDLRRAVIEAEIMTPKYL